MTLNCSLTAAQPFSRFAGVGQDENESKAKVADSGEDYCFTIAWKVAALNRWGYIDQIHKRVGFLSLIDNSVSAMLKGILRAGGDGLKLSLEGQLARQLVADPEDLATKDKLRLIRLCKVFGTSQSNLQFAIAIHLSVITNELFYALLGSEKTERKPCTLRDLLDPKDGVVGKLQGRLVQLACDFIGDAESDAWFLLKLFGLDARDVSVRPEARAGILRLHTGLLHHFVKLLGSFPFILVLTLPDIDVPQTVKRELSRLFFNTPRLFLNLSSQRMQDICGTPGRCVHQIVLHTDMPCRPGLFTYEQSGARPRARAPRLEVQCWLGQ